MFVLSVAVRSENDDSKFWNVGGPGVPGYTVVDTSLGTLLIPKPYAVTVYVYADPVVQFANTNDDRFVAPLMDLP
jgi:hypothetical protein